LIEGYRLDRTDGQESAVWIIVEKATLETLALSVADPLGIPVVALRGYGSQTITDTISDAMEADPRLVEILYVGDFDPTGEDIIRDLIDRLTVRVTLTRLAVTADQIDALGLVPMMGKASDPRAAGFAAKHGALVQVEAEAIDPDTLDDQLAVDVATVLRAHRAPTGTTTLKYWLRGVATCGKCGRRLTTAQRGKGRRIYRCEPAPMGCGGIGVSAAGAEATVEAEPFDYLAGDRDRITYGPNDLSDATLTERLEALAERERDLGRAIASGTITVAIGEEASAEIVTKRRTLESRIASNETAAQRIAGLDGIPMTSNPCGTR
jgi:hypothetical protein